MNSNKASVALVAGGREIPCAGLRPKERSSSGCPGFQSSLTPTRHGGNV